MRIQLGLALVLLYTSFLAMNGCSRAGGHWQHFRLTAIDEARQRNMTIYIHFFKEGDAVCEKQKASLERLIKDAKYQKVGAYRLAYDTDPGVQSYFKVSKPCTLVALKGGDERGRAQGEVDEILLSRILSQAL